MRKPVPSRRFACAPALLAAAGVAAVTGCAPQFQTQLIGQAQSVAGPPTGGPTVVAEIPVPESKSPQVLRYVVALPRAVRLHYQVDCPSAERDGTLGETFEAYRARRLAELERERRAQANLIGAVVGAVAPPVRAQAGAAGPGGTAAVTAEVNPGAAAAQAAHEALPEATLPPGDTGATVVRGKVELGASAAGRCALTLTTDPVAQDAAGTQVTLELVRLVDVEAEERARLAVIRAAQDKKALELRVWLLGSLQRRGADPLARERARAAAQAQAAEESRRRQAAAEDENRRRQVAADAESRRKQAAADEESRRRQAAADEENRRRQAVQAQADQERARREQERRAREAEARAKLEREAAARRTQEWQARQAALGVRWQIWARLQRLGADPMAREKARLAAEARAAEESRRRLAEQTRIEQERRRAEEERLRREREAAAERERREAPERERRARAERERLAKEEADRRAKLEAERKAWLAAEELRLKKEYEARTRPQREAAERRAREWHARQAAVALRWQIYARLQRHGADPGLRWRLEEQRIAARRDEERRQYEAKARRELDIAVARRQAVDLRWSVLGRLQRLGADPDYRRKRDEAMFREMDAEAKAQQTARAEAAERVRWETQAALDLRVLTKLRLRQSGAVDRPACPPPPPETPPPAPFVGATWIAGRYAWNGISWVWSSGHYEHPPETGAVWVPPANISVSGTLVIRPGRWVRITTGTNPPLIPRTGTNPPLIPRQ